jgi:hypothetical protein
VASVENETGTKVADHLPQTSDRFHPSTNGVVSTSSVLDEDGDLGVQLQEGFSPSGICLGQWSLPGDVTSMDDDCGGADLDRGFAGLTQNPARGNPDARGLRHDVDQVGGVDVERQGLSANLFRIRTGVGPLPALGIAQEYLNDVGIAGLRLGKRIPAIDMSSHREPIRAHVVSGWR